MCRWSAYPYTSGLAVMAATYLHCAHGLPRAKLALCPLRKPSSNDKW